MTTIAALNEETIESIRDTYSSDNRPWVIGFSGGKDSSAVVKLTVNAINGLRKHQKRITIIYCDCNVEMPLIRDLSISNLKRISRFAVKYNLPVRTLIVKPKIQDSFFVKIIGRGYPPPTNKFRWCTDRLRIWPIRQAMSKVTDETIMILGTRYDESRDRANRMARKAIGSSLFFQSGNFPNQKVFSPIANYSTEEVWRTLFDNHNINVISVNELAKLYGFRKNEISEQQSFYQPMHNNLRFGCWACTVVRQDKAAEHLISRGIKCLEPLKQFRDWLIEIRDDVRLRCSERRNGAKGPGPFTLSARVEILRKLLLAQKISKLQLITKAEIKEIENLWAEDLPHSKYH